MEPYNYSIDLPQPPASTFLQDLMGIQQMKGLRQQREIQAQQAETQAQQAKFAQELQPLEKQKLEAAIAAQRASTSATQTGQQATQYQLDQRKALDTELLGLSSDPSKFTAENLQKLAVRFHSVDPTLLVRAGEMRKSMPDQAKIFGDNIAKNLVITSVTGDSEAAIKQLDKQLEAAKNTPGLQSFVPQIEELRTNLIKYPDQTVGLAAVGQTLFAPDQGKAITDVLAEQAKIGKAKAETKKELAAAKVEEAKLTPGGKEMSDKQQADINVLTSEAGKIRTNVVGLADSVDDLLKFAEQFPKEFKSGGKAAIQNIMSSISGDTTRAQNLRASIEPYTKAQWIAKASGLKGALSDKESAMLQKGAPKTETAGPAELLNWARLAQKVELADANQKDFDAAWQQNVRSLQLKSPVEFEVSGVVVKPGDSYSNVLTKINAQNRKKNDEEIQADAVRLKRIQEAEKSGQSPVPNMYNLGGAPQQPRPASAPKMRLISIE